MKAPNGRLPRPAYTGTFVGSYPQIFFMPLEFCCAQKNCFKHMITTNLSHNNKNLSPMKCILPSQTLKPGYRPCSVKIVSAIRIFYFESHSASRCSITSKNFFKGAPPSILWGGQSWAATALLVTSHLLTQL